jgi:hypothetical protein
MEIAEAKNKIIILKAELAENEVEHKKLVKITEEHHEKMNAWAYRKSALTKEIKKLEEILETENVFETVQKTEGFDSLLQEELIAIFKGMNKTDYRKTGNYPRWYDLERLVKGLIEFKKLYPGWVLIYLEVIGQNEIHPPVTVYRYKYKTPRGHYMTMDGVEPC